MRKQQRLPLLQKLTPACCARPLQRTGFGIYVLRQNSTFVSAHYRLELGAVASFLERHGLTTRDTPTHTIVRACPLCGKPHGEKLDNLWKLYVRKADGAYFCHRCGSSGSWFDLKSKLDSGREQPRILNASEQSPHNARDSELGGAMLSLWQPTAETPPGTSTPISNDPMAATVASALRARDALLHGSEFPAALQYLTVSRRLSREVLEEYCVGALTRSFGGGATGVPAEVHECIVFPWLSLRAAAASSDVAPSSPQLGDVATLAAHATTTPFHRMTDLAFQSWPSGPVSDAQLVCARLKLRGVRDKSKQALAPRGGGWGLFGLHAVPRTARSIVLTEGEFDAMSVRQATGAHAVSLPNGCRSLPLEVLPMLERFDRLYLWMDDDAPGRDGCERIAAKLGQGRCHIVRPTAELIMPAASSTASAVSAGTTREHTSTAAASTTLPKDANEALQRGIDLIPLLRAAAPRPHEQIVSFSDLRSSVMAEIESSLGLGVASGSRGLVGGRGVPYRCVPQLQRILKGHRPGEVTIVTGPTGCGKTTLLAQLSLDLAAQGVATLWGSFEIKASRLIAGMLAQLRSGRVAIDVASAPPELLELLAGGGVSITDVASGMHGSGGVLAEYERAADVLASLPMQFLRFYGSTDVDRVIDALEYAAYAHDVRHVVLDNLQFMMSSVGGSPSRGFDKFDAQDRALDRFRAFATRRDVHLTLVIHPRKEAEDEPLSMSSVFGTAKATQEADAVLILQRDREGRKYIDVKKNRFDGTLGRVYLDFDAEAKCFFDVPAPEPPANGGGGGWRNHGGSNNNSRGGSGAYGSGTVAAAASGAWTSPRTTAGSRGGLASDVAKSAGFRGSQASCAGSNGPHMAGIEAQSVSAAVGSAEPTAGHGGLNIDFGGMVINGQSPAFDSDVVRGMVCAPDWGAPAYSPTFDSDVQVAARTCVPLPTNQLHPPAAPDNNLFFTSAHALTADVDTENVMPTTTTAHDATGARMGGGIVPTSPTATLLLRAVVPAMLSAAVARAMHSASAAVSTETPLLVNTCTDPGGPGTPLQIDPLDNHNAAVNRTLLQDNFEAELAMPMSGVRVSASRDVQLQRSVAEPASSSLLSDCNSIDHPLGTVTEVFLNPLGCNDGQISAFDDGSSSSTRSYEALSTMRPPAAPTSSERGKRRSTASADDYSAVLANSATSLRATTRRSPQGKATASAYWHGTRTQPAAALPSSVWTAIASDVSAALRAMPAVRDNEGVVMGQSANLLPGGETVVTTSDYSTVLTPLSLKH